MTIVADFRYFASTSLDKIMESKIILSYYNWIVYLQFDLFHIRYKLSRHNLFNLILLITKVSFVYEFVVFYALEISFMKHYIYYV